MPDGAGVLSLGVGSDDLYLLRGRAIQPKCHLEVASVLTTHSNNLMSIDINEIHERLGHVNECQVRLFFKKIGSR